MHYLLSDHKFGDDFSCDTLQPLIGLLNEDHEHWKGGSGDSAVNLPGTNDTLIFFKTEQGIFIEDLTTVTAPVIDPGMEILSVTHYVGGDPMDVPNICLMNKEQAIRIITYFIENNGSLSPEYTWDYIYNYIPYRYDEFPEKELEERKKQLGRP